MTERTTRVLATARVTAVYLLAGAMLAFARPTPAGVAVGGLFMLTGELLRVWAAGHLVKNERLVTTGPYRHVRNPLYLGRLAIFVGLCLMAPLPRGAHWGILVAGLAVFFFYYLPRKERVEPARLRALHGEAFERYHRAVPALLPAWGRLERRVGRALVVPACAGQPRALDARGARHAVVAFLLWRVYSV